MTLQQLESLKTIARLGSFSLAAQLQHVTQSTVSMRIAQLEEELGVKLFNRTKRSVLLTRSGHQVLAYAETILGLTTELKETLACPDVMSGTIRIGVAELLALTWLPRMVTQLTQQYPKIEIDIDVGLSSQMYDQVRAGQLDVCFHPAPEPLGSEFDLTLLGGVQFAFLASPRLELPKRRLSPKDLIDSPIISLGPGSILSDIQADWFARDKAIPVDLKRSNSMEVAAGLVRSGLGISLLPVTYYQSDIRRGDLVQLNVSKPPPHIPFYAVRAKSNQSPLVLRTTEIAKMSGEFDS
jgi:DNA-binding transcriptional LysR family regulator